METEVEKAKEIMWARRQIRQLLVEARLVGFVDGIRKFAWTDDQTGEAFVGPEFDSTELDEAIETVVEEAAEVRKKMIADPDAGPNVAEVARILFASVGVYSSENGVAIAALEIVKNEILQTGREVAKTTALFEAMREAFVAEAPDTEH